MFKNKNCSGTRVKAYLCVCYVCVCGLTLVGCSGNVQATVKSTDSVKVMTVRPTAFEKVCVCICAYAYACLCL